jgi:hypothetical protein
VDTVTYLVTFDPGMSTGITLGEYHEFTAYKRIDFWQVEGGLPALRMWWGPAPWPQASPLEHDGITYVCEKFVPLPAPRTFKTAELEPIRIEGAIEDRLDGNVIWQRASAMVLAQGDAHRQPTKAKQAAARKRASDDVLRDMGLWTTGKQVGCKDANDVNSAQKHAIAYLRAIKHGPTIEALGRYDV